MKAYGKNIRISPKKLRVIAQVVRGQKVTEALGFLKFAPKKGALVLYKIVASAAANAQNNNGQALENLYIDTISVNKGIVYKRGNPISRGRSHPILKRTSNVSLELQVK